MKILRGIGSIKFQDINPYFKGQDLNNLVYGHATSYSLSEEQAKFYCESSQNKGFGWVLSYNYSPKNILYIYENNFIDLDNMCLDEFELIFDKEIVISKNLSSWAKEKGFDCIQFLYDEFDQHILIINESDNLELENIQLFAESQEIVTIIKKLNLPFDGEYFTIPINIIEEVSDLLERMHLL